MPKEKCNNIDPAQEMNYVIEQSIGIGLDCQLNDSDNQIDNQNLI